MEVESATRTRSPQSSRNMKEAPKSNGEGGLLSCLHARAMQALRTTENMSVTALKKPG